MQHFLGVKKILILFKCDSEPLSADLFSATQKSVIVVFVFAH